MIQSSLCLSKNGLWQRHWSHEIYLPPLGNIFSLTFFVSLSITLWLIGKIFGDIWFLSAVNNIDIWNFKWRFISWMNNTIMSVHLFGLVNSLPMYTINLVLFWPKWIGANLALINFYGLRMLYYLWEQKSPTLNLWCTIISQMYHNIQLLCCKYLITTAQYPFS